MPLMLMVTNIAKDEWKILDEADALLCLPDALNCMRDRLYDQFHCYLLPRLESNSFWYYGKLMFFS